MRCFKWQVRTQKTDGLAFKKTEIKFEIGCVQLINENYGKVYIIHTFFATKPDLTTAGH